MNQDLTLLIMAAGMGSRFGGLKQIEPIGPNGEFLIDYSIYDAIRAGFTKVVFVIKEENYEIFKNTIGHRVEKQNIKIEYVFQKNDDLPEQYKSMSDRVKPWGTGHAIRACRDVINEKFAIINADDFYGADSFRVIANYLKSISLDDDQPFAMVGYKTINTLAENGAVKRGICQEENGYLTALIESSVELVGDHINAKPLDGGPEFIVDKDSLVSLNMFGFTPRIFQIIEEDFSKFLEENKNDYEKCEFLIPMILFDAIKQNIAQVKVLSTTAKWYGVTYREDKPAVVKAIQELVDSGAYPNKLWS